jgi:hypothetical protein
MKKTLVSAAAAAAAMSFGPFAHAQDAGRTGAYVNVTGALVDASEFNVWAVGGRVGYRFTDWVGVEGEAAFGAKSDNVTVSGVRANVKLKHEFAGYVVGFLPAGDNFDVLARIGYGTAKVKANVLGFSASDSDESVNYGVGVQYHAGLNGVRLDYTRYDFDDGGDDANVWALSYSRRF